MDMSLRDLSLMLEPEEDGDPNVKLRTGTIVTVTPSLTINLGGVIVPADALASVVGAVGATVSVLTRTSAPPLVLSVTGIPGPWGTSWGKVAYATRTTSQTGISGPSDLTGLSVTFTAVTGRLYLIESFVEMLQVGSSGITETRITDGSANEFQRSPINQAASAFAVHRPAVPVTGISGSQTFKLRAQTTAGTCETSAGATRPAFILVEDIGPA